MRVFFRLLFAPYFLLSACERKQENKSAVLDSFDKSCNFETRDFSFDLDGDSEDEFFSSVIDDDHGQSQLMRNFNSKFERETIIFCNTGKPKFVLIQEKNKPQAILFFGKNDELLTGFQVGVDQKFEEISKKEMDEMWARQASKSKVTGSATVFLKKAQASED